ncbi:hypothetical protein N7478_006829 [Penicillium angulare]|uniref:uncharacterized protein n=1 Tax=Penicillium angulare TaxID=116970 RepID=UPI002541C723|nr:uncharacterized protein N7478_006829 [Penicillium angulare]KAJ5281457.1 hypothetical protein N7478_006829 [Penicillium angulare]
MPNSQTSIAGLNKRTVHPRTVYDLAELKPFPQHADDHNCWQKLFDSAVVAENHGQQPCRGLEVDFNTLVQLAAVEYPVSVGYGLVLMGYSTALVPIQETNDGMILWHLEVSDDDFQLQVADLVVMHQNDWLKTQDLEYLQSKTALLGWCTKARVLLGTDHIDPHVNWSGAQNKPTSWHWKGANLQLVAQSASPLQIGCQAGMSFDRTINTVRYNPSRNYLKCLQSSAAEQIVLYDVSAKRAWLVSLLAVLHHMLLVYCDSINEEFRANLPPRATEPLNGVSASLDVLSNAGGLIIQGTKEDSLTVRELIMGFSVNLSRASLHKPKGAQIYGYEFMDIVMDSPQSELKKQKLERNGLSWSSFLNEVKCLFCSNLGEVIVGARALVLSSPCNSIPGGYDFLAASMHSIEGLSAKSGGAHEGKTRRISANRFWNLTGDPFERCKHVKGHESCWQQPGCLQEIDGRRNHPSSSRERPLTEYINGALVFGEPVKSRKRETSLLFSGMYQSQTVTNDDIPTGEVQVGMEHNPTLDHAFPRMEMDF